MESQASEWLRNTINDPILMLLLQSSNLTLHQLESLLIDHLSDPDSPNRLTYAQRASIRTPPVSRGAFNRTLHQARQNVVSSLYTLLLLAYLGVLQAPPFEQYETLATKIHEYSDLLCSSTTQSRDASHILITLRRELQSGIERLSSPKSLKP